MGEEDIHSLRIEKSYKVRGEKDIISQRTEECYKGKRKRGAPGGL